MAFDYFRILGNYYGYPKCCIDQFCEEADLTPLDLALLDRKDRTEVSENLGFIPCGKHAKRILEKKTTLRKLIGKHRKCPSAFPVIPSKRNVRHLQNYLDDLEKQLTKQK